MQYGLQLYSVRDLTKTDFEGALRQVAEMGYSMVEPAGFFDHKAEDVAAMLKNYGLTACSTHTGFALLKEDLKGVIDYHKAIGCSDIIIPSAPRGKKEEVAHLVEVINQIQPVIEAEGLRLHYHNHWEEFRPNADGQIVEEILANETNVLFQIDTFGVFNAGLRAVDVLDQYRDRIQFIHLKDGFPQNFDDPTSKPVSMSIGSGAAPVEEVRRVAIERGLKIVIESEGLQPTGLEEVKRCIDFLKVLDAKDGN